MTKFFTSHPIIGLGCICLIACSVLMFSLDQPLFAETGADSGKQDAIKTNESSMIKALETILKAQWTFKKKSESKSFATDMTQLSAVKGKGNAPVLDQSTLSAAKTGYNIDFTAKMNKKGKCKKWRVTAAPKQYGATGYKSFFVDQTGILRGLDQGGKPGNVSMPSLFPGSSRR